MKAIDIIEIFNKLTNGNYILHKQVISNKIVKSMKEFVWTLWKIDGKSKVEILMIAQTFRIVDNNIEKAENIMTKMLLEKLFELYESCKIREL